MYHPKGYQSPWRADWETRGRGRGGATTPQITRSPVGGLSGSVHSMIPSMHSVSWAPQQYAPASEHARGTAAGCQAPDSAMARPECRLKVVCNCYTKGKPCMALEETVECPLCYFNREAQRHGFEVNSGIVQSGCSLPECGRGRSASCPVNYKSPGAIQGCRPAPIVWSKIDFD